MFQLDEKALRDSRTLVTVQGNKYEIDPLNKNGTINYVTEGDNVYLTTPKIRANYYKKLNPIDMFDKFLLARNGKNIDGSYSFDGDINFKQNIEITKNAIVKGDLTVEGKTLVVDTSRLSIDDNIIEINKNENGNGITLKRAGTAIKRGTKPHARYIYDEDNKAFVMDIATDVDNAVDSNHWYFMAYTEKNGDYENGEIRARFRLNAPHGKFTDSLIVGKNSTLNNLIVQGESNFKGAITANDIIINGSITSNNSSIFNGIITANKPANFKDNVSISKDINVTGASTLTGLLTANNGIAITGDSNFQGPINLTGMLSVSENATFSKDLSVGSNINALNATIEQTIRGRNLAITENVDIGGSINLTGNFTANKNATFNRDIIFNNGPVTFNANAIFNREITINNKNLTITSDSDNNGQLVLGGHANLKKNLLVNGETVLKGNTSIQGLLDMSSSDLTARNVKATNNYSLTPGDGKGIQFWQSDSYKIYMSNTQTPGLGGRLDETSDYNMYFKMEGGSNRGFAFKSGPNVVAQIESSGKIRTEGDIYIKGFAALTRQDEGHRDNSSGVNADRVDGFHSFDFIKKAGDSMLGNLSMNDGKVFIGAFNFGYKCKTKNGDSAYVLYIDTDDHVHVGYNNRIVKIDALNILNKNNNKIWHEDNDGHESNLDADLLDGKHANEFAESNHEHDNKYTRLEQVDLKNKYAIKYNEEFDSLDFLYVE